MIKDIAQQLAEYEQTNAPALRANTISKDNVTILRLTKCIGCQTCWFGGTKPHYINSEDITAEYQAATAESAARIAELEQKLATASKSIRYLQKHRLWINSNAKAVIDTAVDAVTKTGDKT